MPRPRRLNLVDIPQHITQGGNNRQACFFLTEDRLTYMKLMNRAAQRRDCRIHAPEAALGCLIQSMTGTDPKRSLSEIGQLSQTSVIMTLRIIAILAFLCLAVVIAQAQSAESSSTDEQEIRKLIAQHAAASQTGDFDSLVSGYRADSDVRYADGVLLDSPQAIEQHYKEILQHGPTTMAHSHPEESIRIRFLRDDVAFVDVISQSGGGTDEDGVAIEPRRVAFFVVFTKIDNEWGVAVERMGAALP